MPAVEGIYLPDDCILDERAIMELKDCYKNDLGKHINMKQIPQGGVY